jgi:hypothetical protein
VEDHGHFTQVESRIRNLTEDQLREHGLYGWQLALKLAVAQFFYGRYLLIGTGILKKLLGIIDDLLKSILDAVGGAGAISEIKAGGGAAETPPPRKGCEPRELSSPL